MFKMFNECADNIRKNNEDGDEDEVEQVEVEQVEVEQDVLEETFSIYRFKFTEEFMIELHNFSKIHQYDSRKDFKEEWEVWTKENEDLVRQEETRLSILGYDGNVLDKMFKSARYYFRKKSNVKIDAKQRVKYTSINRELLNAMDSHVGLYSNSEEYQPKTAFMEFCINNEVLVKSCLKEMLENGIKDKQYILSKIKKTYNNRYFIFTNKICDEMV